MEAAAENPGSAVAGLHAPGAGGQALQGEGCSALPRPSAVSVCPADDQIQLVFFETYSSLALYQFVFRYTFMFSSIRIKAVYSGHRDKQERLGGVLHSPAGWQIGLGIT